MEYSFGQREIDNELQCRRGLAQDTAEFRTGGDNDGNGDDDIAMCVILCMCVLVCGFELQSSL